MEYKKWQSLTWLAQSQVSQLTQVDSAPYHTFRGLSNYSAVVDGLTASLSASTNCPSSSSAISIAYVIPVAFAVTVPAEALMGRLTQETLLLAIGLAIMLMIISRRFWLVGIRSYSGASA